MKIDTGENDGGRKVTLNLTSLIDVLFLLIIFFAVSTQFKEIPALDLNLPEAGSSTAQPQTSQELWVDEQGKLFLGSRSISMDSLGAVFAEIALTDSTGVVVLKADEKAPYGVLIKIMDEAQLNGFNNLILATQEKKKR
jgi:biopolymer transport protein ExbD